MEEPVAVEGLEEPRLRTERAGEVRRVWLEVAGTEGHVCFSDPRADGYAGMLRDLLGDAAERGAWLYTPMALPIAEALDPTVLVYDVMDDLASFKGAPAQLTLRQRQALKRVDVVFTGGRSLQRAIVQRRPKETHCFPSGVDPAHYAPAASLRSPGPRPVAGYVGVIDERLDVSLMRGLAAALPEWEIRMVGPISEKLGRANAPSAPNILYTGQQPYERLPEILGEFDVALMPFALNEATRSISPTKTLEYLAAGLPVVSTRVPDVVADYAGIVEFADDGESFAAACLRALRRDRADWDARVAPLLRRHAWDAIAARMDAIVEEAGGRGRGW
ncbi:MAG: glycosyltransferase [Acidimicrobiales bacterium]